MAAHIPKLARVTLFSVLTPIRIKIAKVELAKVKKLHDFELEVINIQEKGQERWKKQYVYWIPALHLNGKEIAKGHWDASTVLRALQHYKIEPDSGELSK